VDWRHTQSEPELAEHKGDAVHKKEKPGSATELLLAVPKSARKPSERFMRRQLQARSRVSQSERFRIDALKEKLNSLMVETANEQNVFNGYRPGHEAMPG